MDALSLANTLAELTAARTKFSILIGGHLFEISPRLVYIPATQFDELPSEFRSTNLPDDQRVIRRSRDAMFRVIGSIPQRGFGTDSTRQQLIFGAAAADAITFDPRT